MLNDNEKLLILKQNTFEVGTSINKNAFLGREIYEL